MHLRYARGNARYAFINWNKQCLGGDSRRHPASGRPAPPGHPPGTLEQPGSDITGQACDSGAGQDTAGYLGRAHRVTLCLP
ncbi:hypothetical protein NDU88_002974 [Pleurodeles waltl]|uniref:Uncharacterized protein n=1 Tax=Pleurodeles waltl TaxID=8319 RepID=A0AAV7W253_PLEWA|nr:hypothetical protein NDU88_002974 [Pleurodeles waltl]